MTARQRAELIDLFGSHAVIGDRVNLIRADAALLTSRYGMSLRMLLIAVGGPLITNRGRKRYAAIMKRQRVQAERAEVLAVLDASPQLAEERGLLAALPPDDTRRLPPPGSRTSTGHWDTYASALRAAAEWYGAAARAWKCSERELATRALGGSKKWTDASKIAFAAVLGIPFDRAVYTTDTGLRMTGPAAWHRQGRLVADLAQAEPFIEIPGRAAADHGYLDLQATGVLLIENQETFEAISTRTTVPIEWLCIWTGGFASHALVHFLRQRVPGHVPIAAWTDLDPPGVKIIKDLAEKSARTIEPVAMDAWLYAAGSKLIEEPDELQNWHNQAVELSAADGTFCPDLVTAIINSGGQRCEQEGLHEHVLPSLHQRLRELLRPISSGHQIPG
ncbi:DUF2220 domain-containing protein [Kitasatospora purpeofusca]|uniref:Wadjet anti-phage system protein JetD domain-containing protein n=1 Tax=Kitasatospora purpeofusca TaxID=67352 RepID=UPI002E149CF0|nr:DUF2220 domain-containing protein [Kitasatospora purpeofusca]